MNDGVHHEIDIDIHGGHALLDIFVRRGDRPQQGFVVREISHILRVLIHIANVTG